MDLEGENLNAEVPHAQHGGEVVEQLQALSSSLVKYSESLTQVQESPAPAGGDKTFLYHYWTLKRLSELAEEVKKLAKKTEESWEWYVAKALEGRGAEGTAALGRKITVYGDIDPGVPSEKSAEYGELIEWLKGSQFAGIVGERFHWQSMKKVCSELAEQGLPPPPHVELYPKSKLRLT
jgi:hypothetical protein